MAEEEAGEQPAEQNHRARRGGVFRGEHKPLHVSALVAEDHVGTNDPEPAHPACQASTPAADRALRATRACIWRDRVEPRCYACGGDRVPAPAPLTARMRLESGPQRHAAVLCPGGENTVRARRAPRRRARPKVASMPPAPDGRLPRGSHRTSCPPVIGRSSVRYATASAICGASISRAPARSAIVRATRMIRSNARELNPSLSM